MTSQNHHDQTPSPLHVGGDPTKLSIHHLAQRCDDVYGNPNDENGGVHPAEFHEVGNGDWFSTAVDETGGGKTLIVAIRGSACLQQHWLNIKPDLFLLAAYHPTFIVTQLNDVYRLNSIHGFWRFRYDEGYRVGWISPAMKIYRMLVDIHGRHGCWNSVFDRIVLTGHSRGGLLAVHVGEFFVGLRECHGSSFFTGDLRVVGFGMPPPLVRNNDRSKRFCNWAKSHVLSVYNVDDPIANGELQRWVPLWKPLSLQVDLRGADPGFFWSNMFAFHPCSLYVRLVSPGRDWACHVVEGFPEGVVVVSGELVLDRPLSYFRIRGVNEIPDDSMVQELIEITDRRTAFVVDEYGIAYHLPRNRSVWSSIRMHLTEMLLRDRNSGRHQ